jgi:hypothetical protein
MLETTRAIVKASLEADATITPTEKTRLMKLLRQAENPQTMKPETPLPPKILQRAEVALRLNRSLRFVDKIAHAGVLRKIKLPGRQRAIGFRETDVSAMIAGTAFAE